MFTGPNLEISREQFFCDVIFDEFSSKQSCVFCHVILSPGSCKDWVWFDNFGHLGFWVPPCWAKKCLLPAGQTFKIFKLFFIVFENSLLKKFQKQNQNLITSWRPSIIKIHQEGVRGWSSFDQKCTSPVFIEPEAVCAGSRGRFWRFRVIIKTALKLTKFKVPKKPSPGFCKIWSSKHRATVQFCRIQGSSFWDVKNARKNKWFLSHF